MSFRVRLTARAEADIDCILGFLRERSPQGAQSWVMRLDEVLVDLADSALQQQIAPENSDHTEEIRHVVFRTKRGRRYRLIFTVQAEDVFVLHVRGPGQDIVP